ncbi:restriction endonuclease subunit R [Dolichospermum circinale]|uniref:restriction endonuclease subunit R n=1 Tax=Dolichospermum circinale TaxID=109265 RepID=UPI00232B10B0|nr:restriction endonuclease subunit R [Dolichospermum circinale]MDB9455821.1 restriction endonuclease subunit R [Dolichospermum circinale CS-541/06]MDB9463104.1 restriction endonuclease subunit R [Dolichospermum circinale CS-541/04]MDB9546029.1 restriction endonuclease subunit R [Dolichospermum circinale CS-1031]
MVQFIQARNIGIAYLEARFSLEQTDNAAFFPEWLENLPEISDLEKQYLDKVKLHFLRLAKYPPLSEETVKLVVLSPLLSLAGFYDEPFFIRSESSIEIAVENEDEVIRGKIDVLVIQQQLWLLVIESKRTAFSLLEAIPQALTYMLANPHPTKPLFGLVMNGSDFIFIKFSQINQAQYALSDQFTLLKRENELYQVFRILKKLGQILN